ncbi:uncharacterized protein LOC108812485 [Raphanus sativus]|uniref:Uncharacterized protein LOC108812485 n=1 Tax=Raphanus sativus TaxID=3726 RepID=A0A6J0JZW7_RAPSA|nr:uncharacterized protein LOC108812485 [Raphanus sativus]
MIARASPMRGEATYSCVIDSTIVESIIGPEKFHANPATLWVLFQAASVLHVMALSIEAVFKVLGCRFRIPSGEDLLFSKTCLLREIQIDQSIQGRISPTIPVGGKQIVPLNFIRAFVNSDSGST